MMPVIRFFKLTYGASSTTSLTNLLIDADSRIFVVRTSH